MMQKKFGKATLELVQGDITTLVIDAIVNAANGPLQHGGGVAAAIARKGGPVIQRESDALIAKLGRPLATSEAVITSGGKLPAKFVIHVAGPIWGDHSPAVADELLRAAVRNSLLLADEKKTEIHCLPRHQHRHLRLPVGTGREADVERSGGLSAQRDRVGARHLLSFR